MFKIRMRSASLCTKRHLRTTYFNRKNHDGENCDVSGFVRLFAFFEKYCLGLVNNTGYGINF